MLRKAQSNCASDEGPPHAKRNKPTGTAFIFLFVDPWQEQFILAEEHTFLRKVIA
ncbi:hypothetical protein [Bradyrhizobium sp.]|uniref:hypothetical protein n=1 Tax=Bradyrhizobium sp. TaxID=376 RepID=UPI002733BD38|nr:hypothetical protein [Bradyrhizobium sp.]MDP3077221.1 hypothetical protein [Bradyrhizobium sp.]